MFALARNTSAPCCILHRGAQTQRTHQLDQHHALHKRAKRQRYLCTTVSMEESPGPGSQASQGKSSSQGEEEGGKEGGEKDKRVSNIKKGSYTKYKMFTYPSLLPSCPPLYGLPPFLTFFIPALPLLPLYLPFHPTPPTLITLSLPLIPTSPPFLHVS